MRNVRLKTLQAGCDTNLQQKRKKMNLRKSFDRTLRRFWRRPAPTESGQRARVRPRHLVQLISGALPHAVFEILDFVIYILKYRLALRDKDNELVSRWRWCESSEKSTVIQKLKRANFSHSVIFALCENIRPQSALQTIFWHPVCKKTFRGITFR